jgi:hypothetical protein
MKQQTQICAHAPCHEGVYGDGGKAPLNFHAGTSWREVDCQLHAPAAIHPVPIRYDTGWARVPVWT